MTGDITAITYVTLARDAIEDIRPLWEKLNRFHEKRSADFKEHFRTNTFEERVEKFLALPDDRLYMAAARDPETIAGYIVATVSADGTGTIDSLFIDEKYRGRGIGSALTDRALEWFSRAGCDTISVGVAAGNEEAFGFYRRFGFLRRMTIFVLGGGGRSEGR